MLGSVCLIGTQYSQIVQIFIEDFLVLAEVALSLLVTQPSQKVVADDNLKCRNKGEYVNVIYIGTP